ncbi:ABC transporter substrate-binding protein [Microcoleus sp. PH2017_20_SFW_D_A]|uniref:ABC transporter substrate-binding protein n=2 Tax=Microcoleus TaxID=44471 RepID=UPI001D6BB5F9|nr:ABC transporter substrate-binding protein [Microcoleus sp. PH2017_20_SFW_D_A]MCC3440158.1 amino acid ABC transporter substrate-binding protein [Microcoleus sp. PH2017_05_CCC_O_A]MCC3552611.1 amino acid ABC transporter substrate-binding protein [Microcoleus sp. PH2017_35_SFW_U_B]TAF98708.1 MAG: ABC transporter substrate-binding protein [Oscillatoriales cyanobacterium]MCC3521598.1 amino acid ABC transporter substrate-binding protein [Microcoleus sp. PH2017_20_SFW_D_A]TAG12430.1 MAG: ABC trans
MYQQPQKRKGPPPIVFIAFPLIAWGAFTFIPQILKGGILPRSVSGNSRLSLGDKILMQSQKTAGKQAGVKAFAEGNYKEAVKNFRESLQQNRNDPETLIYLNNAKVNNDNSLQIAVSVPIGTNPNVAQEMLRGVAQAQEEVNAGGGINGAGLQVLIANDDNSPDFAKEVATEFVKDPKILAVVGHNASNASLAAAPTYQEKKLVMVTPTSFANNLSAFGSYIFRTVPAIQSMAAPLAEYMVKKAGKTNVAICYDSQAPDNVSFKDEFVSSFSALGGKVVPTVCDFSTPTFNSSASIADAVSKGAQALMLAPHIDRIDRAIDLARLNTGKLALYGSTTLYTFQTVKEGNKDVDGLVLSVPWHPDTNPNNPFSKNAIQKWGGAVNWRTATSFDATKAIMSGLQRSNTREGLQQALRAPNFVTSGASEDVRFLPTGDRWNKAILVQVQRQGNDYRFVALP